MQSSIEDGLTIQLKRECQERLDRLHLGTYVSDVLIVQNRDLITSCTRFSIRFVTPFGRMENSFQITDELRYNNRDYFIQALVETFNRVIDELIDKTIEDRERNERRLAEETSFARERQITRAMEQETQLRYDRRFVRDAFENFGRNEEDYELETKEDIIPSIVRDTFEGI